MTRAQIWGDCSAFENVLTVAHLSLAKEYLVCPTDQSGLNGTLSIWLAITRGFWCTYMGQSNGGFHPFSPLIVYRHFGRIALPLILCSAVLALPLLTDKMTDNPSMSFLLRRNPIGSVGLFDPISCLLYSEDDCRLSCNPRRQKIW